MAAIHDKGSGRKYEAEEKLVSLRFTEARGYWKPRDTFDRRMLRCARQEFAFKYDDKGNMIYPWRSKLFIPEASHLAMTAFINIMASIFPKDEFMAILGARGQRDKESAFLTERVLYQQMRQRRFRPRITQVLQEACFLGCAVVRTHWVSKPRPDRRVREKKKFGLFTGYEEVPPSEYNGPDFYPVPFYALGIDPMTLPGNLESAGYITEDLVQSYDDFMADADSLEYLPEGIDYVKKAFAQGQSGTVKAEGDERSLPSGGETQKRVRIQLSHDHEKVIYMASTGGAGQGAVVRIGDINEVSPGQATYPYAAFCFQPAIDEGVDNNQDTKDSYRPGGFKPLGLLHSLVDLNDGMNALVNSSFDITMLGMNARFLMRKGSLTDPSALRRTIPGQVIEVDDTYGQNAGKPLSESVQQLNVVDTMAGKFQLLQSYLGDTGKRVSGTTDPTIGSMAGGSKTATEFMAAQQGASTRFMFHSNSLVETGMIPLVQQLIELNGEYLPPETELELTGRQPLPKDKISRADINRGCTVIIKPSANTNRLLTARVIMEFLPALLQYPDTNEAGVMQALVEHLAEIFDDPASIVAPQESPVTVEEIEARKSQIPQMQKQLQEMIAQVSQVMQQMGIQAPGGQQPMAPQGQGDMSGGGIPGQVPVGDAQAEAQLLAGMGV